MVMLVTFSGVAPGLLTLTRCGALVVPTLCGAKARLSGVMRRFHRRFRAE
jgi:hypothetical protein